MIASDMYLEKEFLLQTLNSKGFHKIDHIAVSSHYRKMKSKGHLFERV